jgi:hypothetical protein
MPVEASSLKDCDNGPPSLTPYRGAVGRVGGINAERDATLAAVRLPSIQENLHV